jgi:regulatory protein
MPPPKPTSEHARSLDNDALYETAVRALGRRARSTAEIRLLLEKKKAGKKQIEAVLQRLRQNGYLDDARFARYFAAAQLENELKGKARVRRDLKGRGLNEEAAEKAISRTYQDVDEAALLRQYIRRKVRVTKPLSKPSTVASFFRRLLRAGFRSDTIIQELKRMLQSPLAKGLVAGGSEPPPWDELLDSLSENSEAEAELDQ